MEIIGGQEAIFSIRFTDKPVKASVKTSLMMKDCIRQLDEYFAGQRRKFELHLQPTGTPFQLHVWDELLKIPYRKTISYLQLSKNIGHEKSTRAVAAANGK